MFNEKDLVSMLQMGGEFERIAFMEMMCNFEKFAPLFFRLMEDDNNNHHVCDAMLALMPFVQKGFAHGETFDDTQHFDKMFSVQNKIAAFFHALDSYLDTNTKDKSETMLERIDQRFPGLRNDLHVRYGEKFSWTSHPEKDKTDTRQLMVFVTGHCNLHCPYCFSAEIKRQEISCKDLERIFRWAKHEGVKFITPCGGEPLMYKHFQRFLDLCKEYDMQTFFATNFTIDCKKLNGFEKNPIQSLHIHLAEETFSNKSLLENFKRNISLAKEHQIELIVRVNIASPEQKIEPWFDFLNETNIRRLHVALTIPSSNNVNQYVDLNSFQRYVPIISHLMQLAKNNGIAVAFAKPIPVCLFPDDVAEQLMRCGIETTACNISQDNCMRNVCLSPAMKLTPCLGLSHPELAFNDSMKWDDISKIFQQEVSSLLKTPVSEACHGCPLWARRLCQGVCLSYKQ